MADDEVNDYESYIYYIHRWHNPPTPKDVVVTIPEMEQHIMSVFSEEILRIRDPIDSQIRPFYHDNWDGGAMRLATVESFKDRSRLGVRRVLGCGHFILCVLYMTLNCMAVQEGDEWPYARFWPELRKDLLSTDHINRDAPCRSFNLFAYLTSVMFRRMFERIPDDDPYKEHVITPQTKLRIRSSNCNPKADESTEKFKTNYQEFLVLHMHVMDEMQMLETEPYHTQYLLLLRRSNAPVLKRPNQATFGKHGGSLRAAMSFRRREAAAAATTVAAPTDATAATDAQTTDHRQQEEPKETVQQPEQQPDPPPEHHPKTEEQQVPPIQHRKTESRATSSRVAQGAGQTRTVRSSARLKRTREGTEASRGRSVTTAAYRWHRSVNFHATQWSRSKTVGWSSVTTRVVERHWRLGCRGCPAFVVSRRLRAPRKGGGRWRRRRFCKWITVKRTVLIKRPPPTLIRKRR